MDMNDPTRGDIAIQFSKMKRPRSTPPPDLLNGSLRAMYAKQNAAAKASSASSPASTPKSSRQRNLGATSMAGGGGEAFSRPTVRFRDVGGVEACLQEVRELCEYPLTHPEIYRHLGVEPPRGILLHGPPGCGKTLLAHAIAGELNVPFFKAAAPELVSGMSGESEEKIRSLFQEAQKAAPSIIFIDEIDAIAPKRDETNRGMERRIVAQLLTCMDTLFSDLGNSSSSSLTAPPAAAVSSENSTAEGADATAEKASVGRPSVVVIGATNRPDALDPALRRAGRFDREISMGIPDESARARILEALASKMRLSGDFNFREIASLTPGFVGADLSALTKEAAIIAVNRVFSSIEHEVNDNGNDTTKREEVSAQLRLKVEPLTAEQLKPLCVCMDDFRIAVGKVQPSSKREGFATAPSVTWDDIGALSEVREELAAAITDPIKFRAQYHAMGMSVPSGVLLFGPPGCGKTMVAKAIAASSGSSFISIKGPELLNKFVGESERAVRQVFARARASAPCVIFFDELDAVCPRRGIDGGSWGVGERVSLQILTEMDGLDSRGDVFVIAATNRPDVIDEAMLRPGRLNRLLYVPLPSKKDRAAIIKTCTRKTPIDESVDFEELGNSPLLEGFSGADLASLVQEATSLALRRALSLLKSATMSTVDENIPITKVTMEDFKNALTRVRPSVNQESHEEYLRMKESFQSLKQ